MSELALEAPGRHGAVRPAGREPVLAEPRPVALRERIDAARAALLRGRLGDGQRPEARGQVVLVRRGAPAPRLAPTLGAPYGSEVYAAGLPGGPAPAAFAI